MQNLDIKQNSAITGSYIIRKYKTGTKELIWESEPIKNLIVSGSGGYGRNIIARILANDNTYPLPITSASIGTDSTAPTNADTDLIAPVLEDIGVADEEVTDNVVVLSFFISNSELANGTYKEFGLFCGTKLFARSIITPSYVKGTNEDTTVEYTITIT
jgi:hypothetical protein